MNKHKSNKIKENSNTVRHLIMGQITTTQNLVAIKEVRHAGQRLDVWYYAYQRITRSHICQHLMTDIMNVSSGLVIGWIPTDHWPFARYVKLRVTHAPGILEQFLPPLRVSDPDMHHDTCVSHVPWCMSGSLTSGFPLKLVVGKTFPAFRAHAQAAIYASGKRPMVMISQKWFW